MQTMWKRSGHCHGGSDLVLKRAVQSGFALLWLPRTRHSYATYALNLIGVGRGKHMESSTPMFMPGEKRVALQSLDMEPATRQGSMEMGYRQTNTSSEILTLINIPNIQCLATTTFRARSIKPIPGFNMGLMFANNETPLQV